MLAASIRIDKRLLSQMRDVGFLFSVLSRRFLFRLIIRVLRLTRVSDIGDGAEFCASSSLIRATVVYGTMERGEEEIDKKRRYKDASVRSR